ncbi:MAG: hypothetical protein IJS94_07055 [Clostridia bacterium]|nr:hypothetical protein [Clostridia bacterium]
MKTSIKSKFRPVFWGAVLIIAAVMIILGQTGVIPVSDTSWFAWWRIVLGALFGGWFIFELVQLNISSIFFPLAFAFMVFQAPLTKAVGKEGDTLISNWLVLLIALLLTIGFSMLMPSRNKTLNTTFGRKNVYYDAGKDLRDACIHDSVGNIEVYITNRNAYDGFGVIRVADNVGRINIHIPPTWQVAVQAEGNLGEVEIPDQNFNASKGITLVVKDNMGRIRVVFD